MEGVEEVLEEAEQREEGLLADSQVAVLSEMGAVGQQYFEEDLV